MISASTGMFAVLVAVVLTCTSVQAEQGHKRRGTSPSKKSLRGHFPKPAQDSDYMAHGKLDPKKVELGRNLFFDKILSGNRNISCATCHHPFTHTGDGLSLSIGEGGMGLSVSRDTGSELDNPVVERVPRNAPAIFNLGALEFQRMFHDGRVEADDSQPYGFRSPAGVDLPEGLENVLAVQAMFPVTSAAEMAGHAGENEIANAAAVGKLAGSDGVWELLAARLRDIPEYVGMFKESFSDVHHAGDIGYVHAANAIAAFEASAWRADNSAFDRFLRREVGSMGTSARRGMNLFYGRARCVTCHSGTFQTDHDFHAIAMPQIGPGKGDGSDGYEDFGRERVTGDIADRYRFRTPTLRNVALTGPWGHDGAFSTLEGVVRHHLNPTRSLESYDTSQAILPSRPDLDAHDFVVQNDAARRAAIASSNELEPSNLSERDIGYLVDFLHALTDRESMDLRRDVPKRVPSGLPVFD